MLKYSEQIALSLYLSDYDCEMSFKDICKEVEAEDMDLVTWWDGISCMRGYDVSTLIHETEEAIREAMKIKG